MTLNLAETSVVKSRPSCLYEANLCSHQFSILLYAADLTCYASVAKRTLQVVVSYKFVIFYCAFSANKHNSHVSHNLKQIAFVLI